MLRLLVLIVSPPNGAGPGPTVKVWPCGIPRMTDSGCQLVSASSSARQYENLPGWPSVVRSMPPGRTSSRLISASRSARPMTAVARSLLASYRPPAQLSPELRRLLRQVPCSDTSDSASRPRLSHEMWLTDDEPRRIAENFASLPGPLKAPHLSLRSSPWGTNGCGFLAHGPPRNGSTSRQACRRPRRPRGPT
jgi:hypothetical protein